MMFWSLIGVSILAGVLFLILLALGDENVKFERKIKELEKKIKDAEASKQEAVAAANGQRNSVSAQLEKVKKDRQVDAENHVQKLKQALAKVEVTEQTIAGVSRQLEELQASSKQADKNAQLEIDRLLAERNEQRDANIRWMDQVKGLQTQAATDNQTIADLTEAKSQLETIRQRLVSDAAENVQRLAAVTNERNAAIADLNDETERRLTAVRVGEATLEELNQIRAKSAEMGELLSHFQESFGNPLARALALYKEIAAKKEQPAMGPFTRLPTLEDFKPEKEQEFATRSVNVAQPDFADALKEGLETGFATHQADLAKNVAAVDPELQRPTIEGPFGTPFSLN